MSEWQYTQIGYLIDNAYAQADRFLTSSDKWHYWMDEAKRLENLLHGRTV